MQSTYILKKRRQLIFPSNQTTEIDNN